MKPVAFGNLWLVLHEVLRDYTEFVEGAAAPERPGTEAGAEKREYLRPRKTPSRPQVRKRQEEIIVGFPCGVPMCHCELATEGTAGANKKFKTVKGISPGI
jgi:hypothetical protein